MGFFWSVVFPIVNLFVYMFVFRLLFKVRWQADADMGEKEVALIMLCGILVWVAFAESLSRATNCLVENANLIQKVVFPSEILPSYLVGSSIVNMMIGMPIVVVGCLLFTDRSIGASIVCLPLLLLAQVIFTLGLVYFLSVFNLILRDTFHVIGVATNVWMFATPIFYSETMVKGAKVYLSDDPENYITFEWMLYVNPMHWLIHSWRQVMVFGDWPHWNYLGGVFLVGLALLFLSSRFFMSQKPRIPDLL